MMKNIIRPQINCIDSAFNSKGLKDFLVNNEYEALPFQVNKIN